MGKTLKTGDRILLAILAVTVIICALAFGARTLGGRDGQQSQGGSGAMVVCQTKSGFYRADPLSSNAEYTVDTTADAIKSSAKDGKNTIRIKNGEVDVISSNCSNQVCVNHDPISRAGEQIVCLPHGLVVEIVQDEDMASKLV